MNLPPGDSLRLNLTLIPLLHFLWPSLPWQWRPSLLLSSDNLTTTQWPQIIYSKLPTFTPALPQVMGIIGVKATEEGLGAGIHDTGPYQTEHRPGGRQGGSGGSPQEIRGEDRTRGSRFSLADDICDPRREHGWGLTFCVVTRQAPEMQ